MKSTINILGGKLFEFIPHALGLFDADSTELEINGFGGNASQAMVLAQILNKVNGNSNYNFEAKIYESKTKFAPLNSIGAKVVLSKDNRLVKKGSYEIDPNSKKALYMNQYIDFPVYHLLLFNMLQQSKSLKISVDNSSNGGTLDLIELSLDEKDMGKINVKPLLERPGLNLKRNNLKVYNRLNNLYSYLVDSLYRSGYLMPNDWEKIGLTLSDHDDVILGLDTNLLSEAFLTNQLLPILAVIEKDCFIQTPNWILMVIPQMVIYELEMAANIKDENNGSFTHGGRKGFRALQEIMELRKNVDHKGISVVSTGNADAMLDVNSFLKSINDNLFTLVKAKKMEESGGARSPKSASGDMLIRSQFTNFVDGINFRKGSYFMTSDKVNAAMHTAQGNRAIYISKPHHLTPGIIEPPSLIHQVRRTIPLGKLIYELCVDFGRIYIHLDNNTVVKLESDAKGKSLVPWIKKQLRVPNKQDFETLIEKYNGKLDLSESNKFYQEVANQLEKIDWSVEDWFNLHKEEDL